MKSVPSSVFSAYRQGENRVTGSILAVLQSLSLRRFQTLLADLAGGENETLIEAVNQKNDDHEGIPDASISANFQILLETKTKKNSVDLDQLSRHLGRFQSTPKSFQRLVVRMAAARPSLRSSSALGTGQPTMANGNLRRGSSQRPMGRRSLTTIKRPGRHGSHQTPTVPQEPRPPVRCARPRARSSSGHR